MGILLGALAITALLLLGAYLARKEKKGPPKPAASGEASEVKKQKPPEPKPPGRRTTAAMEEIARRISFASSKVLMRSMKVGEKLVPSPIPTGDMAIRPMGAIAELPNALTRVFAEDEDMFYGKVAAHAIPVVEYQERVDLIADVAGVPHNVLVLVVDTSTSMKEEGRASWTVGLCQKAIQHADLAKAEVALLPFTDTPGEWHYAKSSEERKRLSSQLQAILSPGGSTDIGVALEEGIAYVKDPSFTDRKILLVTDGGAGGAASINERRLRNELSTIGVELHTVCIGPDNPILKNISKHYDWLIE